LGMGRRNLVLWFAEKANPRLGDEGWLGGYQ
jgi:hypothetical protein